MFIYTWHSLYIYQIYEIAHTEVSYSCNLTRAMVIAHDMMNRKQMELKDKAEEVKAIEQQCVMIEQATKDLKETFAAYKADVSPFTCDYPFGIKQTSHIVLNLCEQPTNFKREIKKDKDTASLAVEMLESVIADTAEKMLEMEIEENYIIASFFNALHQEQVAGQRAMAAEAESKAARERVRSIEEFDDTYESEERRRDFGVAHASEDVEDFEKEMKDEAVQFQKDFMRQGTNVQEKASRMELDKHFVAKDLQEVQDIIQQQLRAEWGQQTGGKSQTKST